MSKRDLQLKSIAYRKKILGCICQAGAGHTGGSLSCIDILNVLYNSVLRVSPQTFGDPGRDRFVQSKGHSVEALFVVLADQGFFPEAELDELCQCGSHLIGHPTRKVPGVEQNTGSLGHGLSLSVGMALAGKMDRASYRVFTLLGDGELAEGSVWEAAMSAGHFGLENLTAIIDHNALQISGKTREVMSNEPLDAKFAAFGWDVQQVNGHDLSELAKVLGSRSGDGGGKPRLIIANTVKGKGVSFMENVASWHHGVPSPAQMEQAMRELGEAEEKLMEVPV